jgi:hypothetical protein
MKEFKPVYPKKRDLDQYSPFADPIKKSDKNGSELDTRIESIDLARKAEALVNEKYASETISNSSLTDTPIIPDKVYDLLPPSLSWLRNVKDKRIRDILLMHILTCVSALNPNLMVYTKPRQTKPEHPSIYFHGMVKAASGKSETLSISKYLYEKQFKLSEEDAIRLKEWEIKKQKHKLNKTPFPEANEKPPQRALISTGNITDAELINCFMCHDIHYILSTEASALTARISSTFGSGLIDAMCKAYHQEYIDSQTQSGGKKFVYKAKLCISLMSVPEDVIGVVKDVKNGLISRFSYYIFNSESGFNNQRMEEYNSSIETPEDFGDTLDSITNMGGCFVDFTRNQDIYIHENGKDFFQKIQTTYDSDAASQIAIRSGGAQLTRIAAILTQIRRIEDGFNKVNDKLQIVCNDDDFNAALLIMQTIFQHNIRIFSYVADKTKAKARVVAKSNEDNLALFDLLPNTFKRKEALEIRGKNNISMSDRTIDTRLKKWVKLGLLTHTYSTYTKTVSND